MGRPRIEAETSDEGKARENESRNKRASVSVAPPSRSLCRSSPDRPPARPTSRQAALCVVPRWFVRPFVRSLLFPSAGRLASLLRSFLHDKLHPSVSPVFLHDHHCRRHRGRHTLRKSSPLPLRSLSWQQHPTSPRMGGASGRSLTCRYKAK